MTDQDEANRPTTIEARAHQAIGTLLMTGAGTTQATEATIRVANFVARGMSAQKAVDEIIADHNAKAERNP